MCRMWQKPRCPNRKMGSHSSGVAAVIGKGRRSGGRMRWSDMARVRLREAERMGVWGIVGKTIWESSLGRW